MPSSVKNAGGITLGGTVQVIPHITDEIKGIVFMKPAQGAEVADH